jgi:hypothetical protein
MRIIQYSLNHSNKRAVTALQQFFVSLKEKRVLIVRALHFSVTVIALDHSLL